MSANDDDADVDLADAESDPVVPRGEHRAAEGGPGTGWFTYFRTDTDERPYTRATGVDTDVTIAPENLEERYHQYVRTVPLVYAPLSIFADAVTEPGWTVEATIDGETDDDMTDALDLWGSNCAIHAQQPGHDIIKLVEQIPEKRRGKGTLFYEKVRDGDGNLVAIMPLEPSSISTFAREDQPILVHPNDDVSADHPRTDDGDAAAYVQYWSEQDGNDDDDQIPFTIDDIVKITFNERPGSAWGTPLWVTIREHVDGLYQKLRDRNASIRLNGHPWRVIQNEHWTETEAQAFLEKHFKGEFSTWLTDAIADGTASNGGAAWRDRDGDPKGGKNTFAGRVDAVPHTLEISEHSGSVPEIDDAIMTDIESIFSAMPVSKFMIAFEEDINQFVVEPQERKDNRNVVKERQLIRETIEPLFREKADELADGERYEGEIDWRLEQPPSENPLERESFDPEAFAAFVDAGEPYGLPREFFEWAAGIDPEEYQPEIDETIPPGVDEDEWSPEPMDGPPGDEGDEGDEGDDDGGDEQ